MHGVHGAPRAAGAAHAVAQRRCSTAAWWHTGTALQPRCVAVAQCCTGAVDAADAAAHWLSGALGEVAACGGCSACTWSAGAAARHIAALTAAAAAGDRDFSSRKAASATSPAAMCLHTKPLRWPPAERTVTN